MGRLTSRPTARGFRSPLRPTASGLRSSDYPTASGFRVSFRLTLGRAVFRRTLARAVARLSTASLLVCAVAAVAAASLPQDLDDVTIAGRVSDQAGAAVSGVRVAVTLAATGARREALTDDEGRYRLVELPPGAYSVRVSVPSFKMNINE